MQGPTPMRLEKALDGLYPVAGNDDDDNDKYGGMIT
jgi:hypothetical protein